MCGACFLIGDRIADVSYYSATPGSTVRKCDGALLHRVEEHRHMVLLKTTSLIARGCGGHLSRNWSLIATRRHQVGMAIVRSDRQRCP